MGSIPPAFLFLYRICYICSINSYIRTDNRAVQLHFSIGRGVHSVGILRIFWGFLTPFFLKIRIITKYFAKSKIWLLFLCSLKEREAKERAAYRTGTQPSVRFFFDNQGQIKSLAKRNLKRAPFWSKKSAKTHRTIYTWNPYKATYIDRASSWWGAAAWNCQGRQETVAFSVFRWKVNLTNTLDIIQSIRFNASRQKISSIHNLKPYYHDRTC